jgi:hypothetical protein
LARFGKRDGKIVAFVLKMNFALLSLLSEIAFVFFKTPVAGRLAFRLGKIKLVLSSFRHSVARVNAQKNESD